MPDDLIPAYQVYRLSIREPLLLMAGPSLIHVCST